MLTQERLKEVLRYNPETGDFIWIKKPTKFCKNIVGKIAGNVSEGRVFITIDYQKFRAHRLAVFYMTGKWPNDMVDHKLGDPSNNAWENLRDVSRSVNMQNRHAAGSNSVTGLLGASPASNGRFRARIKVGEKDIYLGRFDTPELAHEAYLKAKRQYHEGNLL